MDKQTFKWWISSHSQLEKELRTWKMYCQSLAGEVDNMARKVETLYKIALPAMDNCRIQHDDYDTVDACHKCSAVKALNEALHG